MFKHLLPQEARVMARKSHSMNQHLRNSPFGSLAIALHSAMVRLSLSIKRLAS